MIRFYINKWEYLKNILQTNITYEVLVIKNIKSFNIVKENK